jgi:hypothetical protein
VGKSLFDAILSSSSSPYVQCCSSLRSHAAPNWKHASVPIHVLCLIHHSFPLATMASSMSSSSFLRILKPIQCLPRAFRYCCITNC